MSGLHDEKIAAIALTLWKKEERFDAELEYHSHMHPDSWLGATPGEPVPIVAVADLKSVWTIYKDIESRHPGKGNAVGVEIFEKACTAGADVRAVTYRCWMLQILQMLQMLQMLPGHLLASWTHDGQLDDGVFKVAARIPMTWIGTSPQSGLPFDVDSFFREVRQTPS